MSNKPIFVATHPRACSTAFERVFMTRRDTLQCVHEPFGDAYYFGPERLAERYENDEKGRMDSGFSESTYKTIFDMINKENSEGKRLFIKDMAQYWIPPNGKPASVAPSLATYRRGVGTENGLPSTEQASSADGVKLTNGCKTPSSSSNGTTNGHISNGAKSDAPYPYATDAEPGNPTVIPEAILQQFMFTFLIRHPRNSIPSYYRCTIPPLDEMTGFYNFRHDEAGYNELRRLFDYLRDVGHIGPHVASQNSGINGVDPVSVNGAPPTNGEPKAKVDICVIDADDLLDNPHGIIEAFCNTVSIPYEPEMLKWDNEEDHKTAKEAFEKWKGFHEDAIGSTELKPRMHKKKVKSDEEYYNEWVQRYGEEGAKTIKECVDANVEDYEYMKRFAIKVPERQVLLN